MIWPFKAGKHRRDEYDPIGAWLAKGHDYIVMLTDVWRVDTGTQRVWCRLPHNEEIVPKAA